MAWFRFSPETQRDRDLAMVSDVNVLVGLKGANVDRFCAVAIPEVRNDGQLQGVNQGSG
jgi:hypothetical protein